MEADDGSSSSSRIIRLRENSDDRFPDFYIPDDASMDSFDNNFPFGTEDSISFPQSHNGRPKTLRDIATKFYGYLVNCNGAELKLIDLSRNLSVSKRRLYDVVVIFESLGLLVRTEKGTVQSTGMTISEEYVGLSREVGALIDYETSLDQAIENAKLEIINEKRQKYEYLYVRKDRIEVNPESQLFFVNTDTSSLIISKAETNKCLRIYTKSAFPDLLADSVPEAPRSPPKLLPGKFTEKFFNPSPVPYLVSEIDYLPDDV